MNRHLIAFVTVAFMAALTGCGKKESAGQAAVQEESPFSEVKLSQKSIGEIGVQSEAIARRPFSHTITIPAKVVANQDNEALVGSLVPGRVSKVFVKAGDHVKAGQPLMLVEGLEIGEIKAGFLAARANLEYQKANFERQKKLVEEKVGAQKNLLETQNEYEKALAEFHAEENRINAIGLSSADVIDGKESGSDDHRGGALAVKSPISGVVVERNVVIGQQIEGATNAFRIINLASVWVDGQIYEKDLDRIRKDAAPQFVASAYPQQPFSGRIIYLGQVIDEQSRTLTIRAEFTNADGRLKPQMFGELKLQNKAGDESLVIPAEALAKFDNADFLFVQKDDSTFEKRAVKLGAVENELVEISEGLAAGERVVTKGAFFLKSEMLKGSLGEEE
jgi:cobalt-zinc-cadmium efflux system membrane fusion protein